MSTTADCKLRAHSEPVHFTRITLYVAALSVAEIFAYIMHEMVPTKSDPCGLRSKHKYLKLIIQFLVFIGTTQNFVYENMFT